MQLPLAYILLFSYSLVSVIAAEPNHSSSKEVAIRSLPTFQHEIRGEFSGELDARGAIGAVGDVVKMIVDIVGGIKKGIAEDKKKRGEFTHDLVGQLNAKNPKLNYVVCHTKHKTEFDGKQGVDWGHSHQEFDVKIGGTVGYEIYWAKSGKFIRKGDGGYLNWAYIGNVKSTSNKGKEIVFGPR